jgi:hypothetical protein
VGTPGGVEHVRYDPMSGDVLAGACAPRPDSVAYLEGWVLAGRYDRHPCASDTRRWLDRRIHRAPEPEAPEPIRPLLPGRTGTGGN